MRAQGRFFALRVFLFVFGLVVVMAGLLMLYSHVGVDWGTVFFTVFDAVLLYEVLIGPVLVEEQLRFLTGAKIVSIGIALKAIVPFAVLTAALVYVANMPVHPPIALLWVAQLALLFGLCLALYISLMTSAHIKSVEQDERNLRASVDELRSAARRLAIEATRIEAADDAAKGLVDLIMQISEELYHLSPARDAAAKELEERIASGLASLNHQMGGGANAAAQIPEATKTADETLALIRQRKALLSQ